MPKPIRLTKHTEKILNRLELCGFNRNKLISELIETGAPFFIQKRNDKNKMGLIKYIYEFKTRKLNQPAQE